VNILLCVDQALVRDALSLLLEEHGHAVVAAVAGGREAVALAHLHEPDVAVLDLGACPPDAMTAARRISMDTPATAVVLLTEQTHEALLVEAIGYGVRGVLTRDLDGAGFCEMLERAAAGELAITAGLANRLLDEIALEAARHHRAGHLTALTPREQDVLAEMARGRTSNKELARSLRVSENTVRFHIRNILGKLGLHTRTAAVVYALRYGMVSSDPEG